MSTGILSLGLSEGMFDGGSEGTCEGLNTLGAELGVAEILRVLETFVGAIVGVRLGAELTEEGVGLVEENVTSLGALAFAGGAVPVSVVFVLGKDTGFWLWIVDDATLGEEVVLLV